MNGRLLVLLAGVLALPWSAPAPAWGDIGHRIICEIAFQELEPTARERVKAMIREDPEFNTFAAACTWPDQPRRRASQHYVNLPRDAEGLADPCPLADECVVSAIEGPGGAVVVERDRAGAAGDPEVPGALARRRPSAAPRVVPGRPRRQRHGVSGGFCGWDPRAVWDDCIIEQGLGNQVDAIARGLVDNVTDEDRNGARV